MARIFVATRLPGALAEAIALTQQALDRRLVDVKWVEAENLHFTFRFFGELRADEIEAVMKVVTEVAEMTTAFTARLEGIGTFPPRGRPRVVWAGVSAGEESLLRLATALEDGFVAAGLGRADRPFTPHLTLGRVRDPNPRGRGGRKLERRPAQATSAMHEAIAEAALEPAEFEVGEVAVIESRLSPRGPTYVNVHVAPLRRT